MAVTIYDIAKKANVSYATASRVLNGNNYGRRSDSLKRAKEILRIAAIEGYQPNTSAQALVGKNTQNICLLISDQIQSGWSNAYFSQVLSGVEKVCYDSNYGLVLNRYHDDDFEAFFARRKLGGRGFDGIVIAGFVTTQMSEKLRQYKIPFISINKHFDNPDNIPAYYSSGSEVDIALYAYKKGHRRIGFVTENIYPDIQYITEKVRAQNINDCNIVPLPVQGHSDFQSGPEIMKLFLELPEDKRPTLIAGNYQTCAAIIKEMKKHGMKCPDDLSIISRCDCEVCQMSDPKITVITPDNEQIGSIATRKIIEHLEHKDDLVYETCDICNIIIERESVNFLNK